MKKEYKSFKYFFKSTMLTFFLFVSGGLDIEAYAQDHVLSWPKITQEMKPWTRWWWFGSAVDEKNLTAALESYGKAGLGGVEITPIYGVRGMEDHFIDYLSPEWMDKLEYTLREAKRLGIGVDLANASGWPFGGPWISEAQASKNFVSKTFRVHGGQQLTETIAYIQQPLVRMQSNKRIKLEDVKYPLSANMPRQEYAFDQIRYQKSLPLIAITANKVSGQGFAESFDLTDRVVNGKLKWKAPAGEWVVCALFQGDHGKQVERSGPGGEGWVIDHFSHQALDGYLQKFDEAFQQRDLSCLRYYFNDSYEVDDAQGESNWTPEFLSEFQKKNGYDLKDYLPALLGLDMVDMNSRVIYDYRMAIGQLLLDKYTKGWQQWAARQGKGIRNQAHGSPGNVLDLYAASDVPEIEGWDIVNLKSAASASHVSGKKLTSSETCTWLNEHFEATLGEAKEAVDRVLLAGVNHIFYHGTAYSPQEAEWPGWLFYAAEHFTPANSLWEDFCALNQYVARSQSFLQSGKPSNDVLLYFSIADKWSEHTGERMLLHIESNNFFNDLSIRKCAEWLQETGYSWDAVSDLQLQKVTFDGKALLAGGNSYKTIVVPTTQLMPAKTFRQLMELAEAGATILFQTNLPADVPGLAAYDESKKLMDNLKRQLSFEKMGSLCVASYGKGKVIVADDMAAFMKMVGVQAESMVSSGLQYIRRTKENGGSYYFIKNMGDQSFDGCLTLNTDFKSAAIYNLMTGVLGYAHIKEQTGQPCLYLQLNKNETVMIETFVNECSGDYYPYYHKDGQKTLVLSDDWNVRFVLTSSLFIFLEKSLLKIRRLDYFFYNLG